VNRLRVFLAIAAKPVFLLPQVAPPMGLLYLAAYLREKFDTDIRIVNQRKDNCSVEELAKHAVDFGADVVGISALTPSAHEVPPLTCMIRKGLPNALIVLGGPNVTASGADAMAGTEADAAVSGEGELTLEALINAWFDGGRDLSKIPNLMWRAPDGSVVRNPGETPLVEDLDSLPFPAYDLIDMKDYWKSLSFTPIPHRKYISLFTSRGCPYKCIYCHRVFEKRFRAHSAGRVVDEIEHYVKTYGIDTVEILDDVFNLDNRRVIEIAELMNRRNIKVHITAPNGVRADIFKEETMDALVGAGLDFCSFALESGSPRIQELMGKRLNIPKFLQTMEWASRRGVFVHCFNMLGFPTETAEEMQQTIDVCLNSKTHTASFFTVTPYPGTALYRLAMETVPERMTALDYRDIELSNVRINLSAVPDNVLFAYQRKAQRTFYMRPSRIWRILRDHPQRTSLLGYGMQFLLRANKQLLGGGGS